MKKKKHIISSPRSGKTTEILSSAGSKDIIIVRRGMQQLYAPHNPTKQKAHAQLLVVGTDLSGIMLAPQRIFIDDLLSYKQHEVEWLWECLYDRTDDIPGLEVIAFSTPMRKYRRELLLLNALLTSVVDVNNIKCPLIYGDDRKHVLKELLELRQYLLGPDVEIELRRKSTFIRDLAGVERAIGDIAFDIQFNLNMLE